MHGHASIWAGQMSAQPLQQSHGDVEQGTVWDCRPQVACRTGMLQHRMPHAWQAARVGTIIAGMLVCASVALFTACRP